jgi:DNA-directed RNA polymerase subunit alpha
VIIQNWKNLKKPTDFEMISGDGGVNKDTFSIAPYARGMGLTVGNALRRILLSSLPGMAVKSIKVKGVSHEFSSVPGVTEDVTHMILNIKGVRFKSTDGSDSIVHIKEKGPKVVTAADIACSQSLEVINKDTVICHLEKGHEIDMELHVGMGVGYSSVENREIRGDKEIGLIVIDAIFSPVLRVAYKVENARVGQATDYDKLIITVTTDGTCTPRDAMAVAARILQDQVSVFVNFNDNISVKEEYEEGESFNMDLLKSIDDLELSVRANNCLKSEGIKYLGQLVSKKELEMLKKPNFGKKSLDELKQVLSKMGLHFGMNIEWPPENINELLKKSENSHKI